MSRHTAVPCVVLLLIALSGAVLCAGCSRRRPCMKLIVRQVSWIEIQLVDDKGLPVSGERYRVRLPDGRISEGRLDEQGKVRVSGAEPGKCRIDFPDLDKEAWQRS